jgi:hypothetical protein
MNRAGIWLGAAALAASMGALWRAERGAREGALAAELADLRGSVRALEVKMAAIDRRPVGEAAGDAGRSADAGAAPDEVATRAEALAAQIEQLHQRLGVLEAAADKQRRAEEERERTHKEELRAAHATMMDPRAEPKDRLRALKKLRSADERTHEESLAALELIERPNLEADVRLGPHQRAQGADLPGDQDARADDADQEHARGHAQGGGPGAGPLPR